MYFEIPDRNIRILGSLHIFPPGTSSLPAWATDAYEWAEVMAIEHERNAALEVIIAAVERREPWALLLAKIGAGLEGVAGIEAQFADRLQQDGRPPFGAMETPAFLDRLAAIPMSEIERADQDLERLRPRRQAMLDAMYRAWVTGSVQLVEAEVIGSPIFASTAWRHAMLTSRNLEWAQSLARLSPQLAPTLLIVGCMHLVGPESFQAQLRELGVPTALLV